MAAPGADPDDRAMDEHADSPDGPNDPDDRTRELTGGPAVPSRLELPAGPDPDPGAAGPGEPDPEPNADGPRAEPPGAEPSPRVLRRSTSKRIFGGVAAGIAEYLGIDALLVRIAFVVLAFVGGSGVLLYAAGWLLIPGDSGQLIADDWLRARPRRRNVVVLVLGVVLAVIAVSNLFASGPWWPHWNHGVGFFLGLFALVLAVALVARSGGNRTTGSRVRWLLLSVVVAVAALVAVAAATIFTVQALSGVPLRGGIGDTQWRPTTAAHVAKRYELAMGNLTVDLRDVTFASGTTHVKATVGIGRVVVVLPPGPTVSVTAHSGLGTVHVFGHDQSGVGTRTTVQVGQKAARSAPADAGPVRIELDAEAGVGQVEVVRSR
jgi:phage shock protein PspC (stress-responsive transcriptional regulator)